MSRLEKQHSKKVIKEDLGGFSNFLTTIIMILLFTLILVVSSRYVDIKAIENVVSGIDDAIMSYHQSCGMYPQTMEELKEYTEIYIDETRYKVSYNVLQGKKPTVLVAELGTNTPSEIKGSLDELEESYE